MRVDPVARHVREGGEVLGSSKHLGLEPPHLARRGRLMTNGTATRELTHHRIDGQIVGVVDVLIAGKPAVDRLARKATMLCSRL